MSFRDRCTALVICFLTTFASQAVAGEAAYFRGDNGLAAADEIPLPDKFGEKAPLAWKQEIDSGHSTPCLHGKHLFLTTFHKAKKELATVALDAASGEIKWKRVAPAKKIEPFHSTGSPATCSPACDGERVYVFFGSYGLLCYDFDGKLVWSKEMGPFQDEFGANSSPIVADGKIILNQDHDIDNFIIAVDCKTGDTLWTTKREGFTRSYSTPIVYEADGKKQVIVAGSLQMVAYDLETGKRVWWVNGLARIVSPTPVLVDGVLYTASWTPGGDPTERISMEPWPEAVKRYDKNKDGKIAKGELPEGAVLTRFFRIDLNQDLALDRGEWEAHARVFELAQNALQAVKPGGMGDVTDANVLWRHRKSLPAVSSPLVYRDIVYIVRDGGIVTSVDKKTGKVQKQGRAAGGGGYYASPVAGDGKIYLASRDGILTVLKAGAKWDVLSSHDFGEQIMATPVIDNGRVFVRTEEALYCFGQ